MLSKATESIYSQPRYRSALHIPRRILYVPREKEAAERYQRHRNCGYDELPCRATLLSQTPRDRVDVVYWRKNGSLPLSESVQDLLGAHTQDISTTHPQSFSINLRNTIESGQVIWQSKACCGHAVVKCTSSIVVKIVPNLDDYTEYTSMQYLAQYAPEIPAPKPLGSVISNRTSYIFMSFIPGLTVDKMWSKLSKEQKVSIRDQLNDILLKLRQLKVPRGVSLGGVSGEACKDTRRHTRICQAPISTCADFEDFKFSSPHFGSSEYIALLRGLSTNHAATVCFSHGGFRAENVVVQPDEHGNYFVTGILDWEKSGFYPDSFECTKATSNMSSSEADDWYLYLPTYASPATYPLQWLVDRIWDIHVA